MQVVLEAELVRETDSAVLLKLKTGMGSPELWVARGKAGVLEPLPEPQEKPWRPGI